MRVGVRNLSGLVDWKTLDENQVNILRDGFKSGRVPDLPLMEESIEDLRRQVVDGWHVPLTAEDIPGNCPRCRGTARVGDGNQLCSCQGVALRRAGLLVQLVPSMVGRAIPPRPSLLSVAVSARIRVESLDEFMAYAAAHVYHSCQDFYYWSDERGEHRSKVLPPDIGVTYRTRCTTMATVAVATVSDVEDAYRHTDMTVRDSAGRADTKVSHSGSVVSAYGRSDILYLALDRKPKPSIAIALDDLVSFRRGRRLTTFLWVPKSLEQVVPGSWSGTTLTPNPDSDAPAVERHQETRREHVYLGEDERYQETRREHSYPEEDEP